MSLKMKGMMKMFKTYQMNQSEGIVKPEPKQIEITATGQNVNKPEIVKKLKGLGLQEVSIFTEDEWYAYLHTLPENEVKGFRKEAHNWIRLWANGGGDHSTYTQIIQVVSCIPSEWAEEAYNNIVNFTHTPKQAFTLLKSLLDEVLSTLGIKKEVTKSEKVEEEEMKPSQDIQPTNIVIKWNGCSDTESCIQCGAVYDVPIGFHFFIEGTGNTVCRTCVEKISVQTIPLLAAMDLLDKETNILVALAEQISEEQLEKLTDSQLEILWNRFSDIPINQKDELEEDFLIWKIGENRFSVWQWFDKYHSKGVDFLTLG